MNELNTNKCPVGVQGISLSPLVIVIMTVLLLSNCRSQNEKHRPSPLSSDSVTINGTELSIIYSSPKVRKREIWGNLVSYGRIWRTGANEATIFSTSKDVIIAGKRIPAGKYSLFTIPNKNNWTIIFNKDWEQWGAFNYEEAQDILRLEIQPKTQDTIQEEMIFKFTENALIFSWEKLIVEIPIETI